MKFPALPFALLLLMALPIGAFADPDARQLVRESVDRLKLQTELPDPLSGLPGGTPRPNSQSPAELPYSKSAPRAEQPGPKSTPPAERPDASAAPQAGTPNPAVRPDQAATLHTPPAVIRVVLWGTVIAGILLAVWSLRDSLPFISRSRKIVAPSRPPPSPAASSRLEEAGLEADDLARQGQYREAMHLLLLKSLSEMRRQLKTSFAISLTSREILRRVQLPDIGRQSLRAIIAAVERTYFRGDDAGQDDYADCRRNFETLKQSLARVAGT